MKYDLSDVEVNGQDILSFMSAISSSPTLGSMMLQTLKIGTLVQGKYQILAEEWYPLTDKITIIQTIRDRIGPMILKKVGREVPENAIFPPNINDIYKAIASVNIAYHMNHRKAGKIMYDEKSEQIIPGIGYYGYEPVPNQRKIISVCENPNLSEYDEGILTAMARRFEPFAEVFLDPDKPTRKNGGNSCTFIITW